MDTIGEKMKKIEVTETELSILLGLVLLDPGVYGIQESTRQFLKGVRDQLIQDVYMYYEDEMSHLYDPEIRMADLFMLVAAVKVGSRCFPLSKSICFSDSFHQNLWKYAHAASVWSHTSRCMF